MLNMTRPALVTPYDKGTVPAFVKRYRYAQAEQLPGGDWRLAYGDGKEEVVAAAELQAQGWKVDSRGPRPQGLL